MQVVDAYDSIPARANDTTISIVGEDGDIWFCSIFWGWMGGVLTQWIAGGRGTFFWLILYLYPFPSWNVSDVFVSSLLERCVVMLASLSMRFVCVLKTP